MYHNSSLASMANELSPQSLHARLRGKFRSGETLPLEWRASQLRALQKMVEEGREAICEAMHADLKISAFEAEMTQLNVVLVDIAEALRNLHTWAAPTDVSTGLFTFPAKSSIASQPLGVTAILGAWNFPFLLAIQPLVGAIAAGCCAVLKPGSYAPATAEAIRVLVERYLDNDAYVVCTGNRQVTADILALKWDLIFFTGSPDVGKVVYEAAARQLTPVVLELGGKSPCIVDRNVQVDVVARRVVWGALLNCGQLCIRPDYILVHESVHQEFLAQVKQTIEDFHSKNPQDSQWLGRLVNDKAFDRVHKLIQSSKDFIVCGGGATNEGGQRYIAPTVMDFSVCRQEFEKAAVMQEEVFGPILPIATWKEWDADVLSFINERQRPLALYLFTEDAALKTSVTSQTHSGALVINDVIVQMTNSELPFGGVGASGLGCYHGKHSFDAFSHRKPVVDRMCNALTDIPMRYPPYTPGKQWFLKLVLKPWVGHYFVTLARILSWKRVILFVIAALFLQRRRGFQADI